MSGTIDVVVFVTIDGNDFEIVGHAFPSGEGRAPAARAPATPEQMAAMEAVERLLSEREEAFRTVLKAYLARNQIDRFGGRNDVNTIGRLWQTEVLGAEDDTYRIRAQFDLGPGAYDFGDIVVFLKIDGDDFEIVGHELVSDEEPRQAARAPATPEQRAAMAAVERLLHEREEAFRTVLQAYMLAHMWDEKLGGRGYGWVSGLRQTEVLGAEDDTYRIRVLFYTQWGGSQLDSVNIVVFLKIDGEDFEIVGHEFPSDGQGRVIVVAA